MPVLHQIFVASGDETPAISQSAQLMANLITNAATVDPMATSPRLAKSDVVEEARSKLQSAIKTVAAYPTRDALALNP